MKRIVSVVTGWHFPLHFYKMVAEQIIPNEWEHDMFVVAHRPPELDIVAEEKTLAADYIWPHDLIKNPILYDMDRELYSEIPTVSILKKLGFTYMLEPNIGGDFTNVNQWMKKHDWKKYDILFMPHDDNYITSKNLFVDVIEGNTQLWRREENGIDLVKTKDKDWWCLSNSSAPKFYHIRWCFSFMSKKLLELIDGHFDMSSIKLSRVGLYNTPKYHSDLSEWNKTSNLFRDLIFENNLTSKIKYLSPYYRCSKYNIECERGFLHYSLSWSQEYQEGFKRSFK